MLVNKMDGRYLRYNLHPKSNWIDDRNYVILDETTPEGFGFAELYEQNHPLVTFEHDGEFVTSVFIIELERPLDVVGKEIELIKNEQGQWEYIYLDIPLEKVAQLELDVIMLKDENMNLMLASAEAYETMYSEDTQLMLAIAEVYETLFVNGLIV